MFSKLIELVKEAIKKMVGYKNVADTIEEETDINISSAMKDAVNLWKQIYKDEAPWLNDEEGVYSLQLGKAICQSMQMQVMSEVESKIDKETERSKFLDEQYQKHIFPKLPQEIEVAMALGSMIMKPYIVNGNIYVDFCRQGTFVPLAYDDDGNIIDVIFPDRYVTGKTLYVRLERQTFDAVDEKIVIENKAFKSTIKEDDEEATRLGTEVPLTEVKHWESIEPLVTIENVTKPMFGYYKVPLANNIDLESPLGISVFSPAIEMIKKADEQFSRLDWEYEGGQLAVDVDITALRKEATYFGGQEHSRNRMDRLKNRLYRDLDLGTEETYNVFAPSLRDVSLISGLDKYLTRIEDLVGLARGSLSEVEAEGRTATEIRILKQRTYITITSHQKAIEQALEDLIDAMNVFADLYKLAPGGDYELVIDWKDSILTDTQEELNQRLQLINVGVEAKWETRAWYKGEDEETAKKRIAEIQEEEDNLLLNDIFADNESLDNPVDKPEPKDGDENGNNREGNNE